MTIVLKAVAVAVFAACALVVWSACMNPAGLRHGYGALRFALPGCVLALMILGADL